MREELSTVIKIPSPDQENASAGSSLIPVINKLQDIMAPFGGNMSGISLPQVAVVGSQSCGKSSVLEAIVRRDFLPRGCGICTRRPLRLMLEHRACKHGDDGREWGEFGHLQGKRFYDFSEIRREIQVETERETGHNKGVSDNEIRLKIYSPNVLNMSLIDLPGITKVPVGDQPSDIETRIKRMIMAYIREDNCIILAVTPANSDLATSDALQLAKVADPTGSRTIGVITKLDIMDRGTNARNVLLGKVVPLRLGYVGVVNHSQEDIAKNRSIKEALEFERLFFQENHAYGGLSDLCGVPQLGRKLNQILENRIRNVLPNLKADMNCRMRTIQKDLQIYGEVVDSKEKQRTYLLNILKRYCEDFSNMVDGNSPEITKQLVGGARIHNTFQSTFVKTLENMGFCADLTDEGIQTALKNGAGPRTSLFLSEVAFQVLVKIQIARLRDPCIQCLKLVYDELINISRACETTELQRFPFLKRRIDDIMRIFLDQNVKPAEKMIEDLIEMEKDYINTSHPDFIGGRRAADLAAEQMNSTQPLVTGVDQDWMTISSGSKNSTIQESHPPFKNDKHALSGNDVLTTTWGIKSIFRSKESSADNQSRSSFIDTSRDTNHKQSVIQLIEPPAILSPGPTDHSELEVYVTKLLMESYFDIVKKNIQDMVPKTIMHFLVNKTKKDVHSTFIQTLYREDLFEELMHEDDQTAANRKYAQEMYLALKQSVQMLAEVESEVSS